FFALTSNTSGQENTANGAYSLASNTNGYNNTANGYEALYSNTSGGDNVANGVAALYANTSGNYNTASGQQALTSNTNGSYNTADGMYALNANTSGSDNTANGYAALYDNTIGTDNTADGLQALYHNTNGSYNTADGVYALNANTSGSFNTADGFGALVSNTSGSNNIALGNAAGQNISTGSLNIDIGNVGGFGDANIIRIGSGQTQTLIAGIYGVSVYPGSPVYVNSAGQLGTVNSSPGIQQNIQSMADASDVLLALRPVTFHYKPGIDPKGTPQFGLVAGEVEKVDPDLVVRDDKHQILAVRYEAVNAMLLNEFLKQHRTVEDQNTKLQSLKQQNQALEKRLEHLEQMIK